jgi:gamma-resorcylate decarboxylase
MQTCRSLPSRAVQDAIYRGHPELVGATWGFAPETATHVLRIVYGGVFDRHPEAKLTTSGNFNDQALITALLTVSADHIMFASDYPYDMATDAARWIETAPISENDRRKICYGNAATLFGLPR